MRNYKDMLKQVWNFLWNEDSVASWIANIILAFLIIRFIVYPLLGLMLGTSFPVVAVVSESMEHGLYNGEICGQEYNSFPKNFDSYWNICGSWYESKGITKDQFFSFRMRNGFNKGDIILLWRANQNNLDIGDILVFWGSKPQPIIHRIVAIGEETNIKGETVPFYQTKGDHNRDSFSGSLGEDHISQDRIVGQALLRIPYLGWIKILFVNFLSLFGINGLA
jgi:signal peptidase I